MTHIEDQTRTREKTKKTLNSEDNISSKKQETIHEFNSFVSNSTKYELANSLFNCGIFDYFNKTEIDSVLKDPILNYDMSIKLSELVYSKNGVVSNSIDYMTSLMCLDRIVTSKSKKKTSKTKQNKDLMKATLETIKDKEFIRNALFTQMLNGIAFFYFETVGKSPDNTKFMNDYDVQNIYEINELGLNASIIPLPWEYTKIIGKKNGRYVLAFNLQYFDTYTGTSLKNKLRKYPKEIVDGYQKRKSNVETNGNWLVLDNNKTMCKKIKSKDSEPWGRSLVIAALSDVLYKDYFVTTKRNVLDELNSKVIYETFPEGKEKGLCALTKTQQEEQHNTIKNAVLTKRERSGISFFSVAAGTKLDTLDTSVEIFDSKNESSLDDQISMDLGICASLIGAMSTGNFASSQNNLEMITSQVYTWVSEWQNELNFVINKNIIKDPKNKVEIYYFPTSFVNRQQFFDMMMKLYTNAGGSLTFLIASTGIDPDIYLSVLDDEIEDGFFEKYLPHQTSWTVSENKNNNDQTGEVGRPKSKISTNNNTIKSQSSNGNDTPSPSD